MNDSNETSLGSEDDTFRILARPDIHKMVMMHTQYIAAWNNNHSTVYPGPQNLIFCKQHGWNWIEFLRAKRAAGYSP